MNEKSVALSPILVALPSLNTDNSLMKFVLPISIYLSKACFFCNTNLGYSHADF
jgi:hypothetical protein